MRIFDVVNPEMVELLEEQKECFKQEFNYIHEASNLRLMCDKVSFLFGFGVPLLVGCSFCTLYLSGFSSFSLRAFPYFSNSLLLLPLRISFYLLSSSSTLYSSLFSASFCHASSFHSFSILFLFVLPFLFPSLLCTHSLPPSLIFFLQSLSLSLVLSFFLSLAGLWRFREPQVPSAL